jgi:hypothetical protein
VVHGKSPWSGGSYRNEFSGDVTQFSVCWPIARTYQREQFASPRGKRIIPWWRRIWLRIGSVIPTGRVSEFWHRIWQPGPRKAYDRTVYVQITLTIGGKSYNKAGRGILKWRASYFCLERP